MYRLAIAHTHKSTIIGCSLNLRLEREAMIEISGSMCEMDSRRRLSLPPRFPSESADRLIMNM